ncbi:hypothetical protein [Albidovulum sp.]|uniref:hypothetical protein n=1 Tax=Albidovulum sp. TaxID=1872424 RepID=UPI0039B9CAFB
MRHPILAAVLLSACATVGPAPVPQGEVAIGTDRWPIEALDAATWRVRVDGRPVPCARPTTEACYWSARHHLLAQQMPDLPG